MLFLYNIVLHIAGIITLPYWIIRILGTEKYRKNFIQRFGIYPKHILDKMNTKKPIWIHSVSVGETLTAVILVKSLKKKYPDVPIILSTVTVTGNKIARQNEKLFDGIIYFPLDFPWIIRSVIRRISPRMVLILEKELWPNFLHILKKKSIPVLLVNGRLSEKSVDKYKRWKMIMKPTLDCFTHIFMQTKEEAERIQSVGADPSKISVTGNLKFDITPVTISEEKLNHLQKKFGIHSDDYPVFIAGSTHSGEEEIVLDTLKFVKNRFSHTILILAPRHPERSDEVEKLIREHGFTSKRFTKMQNELPDGNSQPPDIYLIDTVGELFNLYPLANVVFVGGSLVPIGGHNILEPAIWKKAVVFGPYMDNFLEAADLLISSNGGIQLTSGADMPVIIERLLISMEEAQIRGEEAYKAVLTNSGATERTILVLEKFLN